MLAIVGQLLIALVTLAGLGLPLAARLPWSPRERLAATPAISLALLYLLSFAVYAFSIPWMAMWLVTLLSAVILVLWRGELQAWWRDAAARHLLIGWAGLCLWAVALASVIFSFSGGGWGGDWVEHFERVQFFAERRAVDTVLGGHYLLPARPPLVNLATTGLIVQVGESFALFQLVITLLSTLAFFPLGLLTLRFSNDRPWTVYLLAVALACSPMFMQNATYTWTKLASAMFILLGLYLYLVGWDNGSRRHTIAAFVALAFGLLAHWSAAPYTLFLACHYLGYLFWKRQQPWRELLMIAAAGIIILSTWFGWSLITYGVTDTFRNPSSVYQPEGAKGVSSDQWRPGVVAGAVTSTLVPYPLIADEQIQAFKSLAAFRDLMFVMYQSCLTTAMGVGVLASLGILAFQALWNRRIAPTAYLVFWLLFVPVIILLGVAVQLYPVPHGVAQLCLQPLVYLAVALVVGKVVTLPRAVRIFLLLTWAVELILGILIHFYLQSTLINVETLGAGQYRVERHGLGRAASVNAVAKESRDLLFIADMVPISSGAVLFSACLAAVVALAMAGRVMWQISGSDSGRSAATAAS